MSDEFTRILQDDAIKAIKALNARVQHLESLSATLNNPEATTNPTITDDQSLGYSINSFWYNVSTGEVFTCTDSTIGAAIWNQISYPNFVSDAATDPDLPIKSDVNGDVAFRRIGVGGSISPSLPIDVREGADGAQSTFSQFRTTSGIARLALLQLSTNGGEIRMYQNGVATNRIGSFVNGGRIILYSSAGAVKFDLYVSSSTTTLSILGLPTSNPGVSGRVWNNSGVLNIV